MVITESPQVVHLRVSPCLSGLTEISGHHGLFANYQPSGPLSPVSDKGAPEKLVLIA